MVDGEWGGEFSLVMFLKIKPPPRAVLISLDLFSCYQKRPAYRSKYCSLHVLRRPLDIQNAWKSELEFYIPSVI